MRDFMQFLIESTAIVLLFTDGRNKGFLSLKKVEMPGWKYATALSHFSPRGRVRVGYASTTQTYSYAEVVMALTCALYLE